MDVSGIRPTGGSSPVNPVRAPTEVKSGEPASALAPKDEVEISSVGKMLDDISRTPGIREERIAQLKAEIEAGTYDTPEKMELALSRMLDQVARDEGQ